ncbi:MAG TPA: DUF3500 domain-containing protein, partial [Chthonomonadales bacterium]|nr:DUF3500 domain-containing protein [Chthonomonadales bacterium]
MANRTVADVRKATQNATTGAPVAVSRREFLVSAGASAAAVAAGLNLPAHAAGAAASRKGPESLVKTLYHGLSPAQKEKTCLPWTHPKRTMVQANWAIVDGSIGSTFTPDQQEINRQILKGVVTDAWYPKVLEQMQNDDGGFEKYHVAVFGEPCEEKFEWVITGRHVTLRVDGHSDANAAFGGPIFYGHAPKFVEDAGHPGNIYWEQSIKANAVYAALDPAQRAVALLERAPAEDSIHLAGSGGRFP